MSHDRGCPCGKEGRDEYLTCKETYCHRLTEKEREEIKKARIKRTMEGLANR